MIRRLVSLLLFSAILLNAAGALTDRPQVVVPLVSRPPQLADFLSGEAPEQQVKITDFRQREPHDGEPATRSTAVYLSHDSKNLYAVFVCHEDPAQIRAHIGRREEVAGDDLVGIALDTFHDGRRAYVFYTNPYGIQADGIATEGLDDDYTFNTVWHSEGRITEKGYVAMIAIPFRSLRFRAEKGSTWGVALTRFIPVNREAATWPRLTMRADSYIPQFAQLAGLDEIPAGHNVQIVPYGFLEGSRALDANAPGYYKRDNEIRGGVDSKFTFAKGLTLDTTINPDFSQIESDDPQVTINQRYEVAFPERRPFFTDNASFFDTPETLFFSRRIVDPQFGTKLTGKLGDWNVGALFMDDREPGREVAPDDPNFGQRAINAVVRVQRNLGTESAVGVIATDREFGNEFNRVAAADVRWKLDANWIFTGQAMGSADRREDSGDTTGVATFTEIRHTGRHFNYASNFRWRSPDFHTELGYIPRVDMRQAKTVAGYRWRPESGPLLSFGPSSQVLINYDHTGRLTDWLVDAPFFFEFRGPISVSTDSSRSYEYYLGRGFEKHYNAAYASVERWKRISLNGSYGAGTGVNYYPAANLAPWAAGLRNGQINVMWRPSRRTRIEGWYLYNRLGTERSAIYNNHLIRTKVNHQFSPRLSLRMIADYNAVLSDPTKIDFARAKQFRTDVLATYMVNPWTALYVGYGDAHENLTLDNLDARTRRPSLLTGRQVYAKVSYLIRF